ncbi:hypothetical protein CR513_35064, partial [Mucuna pruriens]
MPHRRVRFCKCYIGFRANWYNCPIGKQKHSPSTWHPRRCFGPNMEDELSGRGSTLILGRPFLMTTRTKIDVHVETLSMEFCDNMVLNTFAVDVGPKLAEIVEVEVVANQPPLPSILQLPSLEIKPLLEYLKYPYLKDDQKLPIIIANNL